eukprot:TRINITY_DN2155_c0_g1_i1.p1 TRINITY_DN2155_c0_g1~~TRINITY_DN2155_c0_g1_i1.p1  ORF type:complete len:194 (+),score=25.66 TRINITY_DN2155_c0_g1_i1:52-633(+)
MRSFLILALTVTTLCSVNATSAVIYEWSSVNNPDALKCGGNPVKAAFIPLYTCLSNGTISFMYRQDGDVIKATQYVGGNCNTVQNDTFITTPFYPTCTSGVQGFVANSFKYPPSSSDLVVEQRIGKNCDGTLLTGRISYNTLCGSSCVPETDPEDGTQISSKSFCGSGYTLPGSAHQVGMALFVVLACFWIAF